MLEAKTARYKSPMLVFSNKLSKLERVLKSMRLRREEGAQREAFAGRLEGDGNGSHQAFRAGEGHVDGKTSGDGLTGISRPSPLPA